MSEIETSCVFELDAGLIMVRLLGEEEVSAEMFERLSTCAQGLAEAEGRTEIGCTDLRRACEILEPEPAAARVGVESG